jgi:hypothetical protein
MKSKFTVKNQEYELALEKKARGEDDKFNPYSAKVSGQPDGTVAGTCQITDAALEAADKKASASGADAGDLLAEACGKSIASELVIRTLKPDFSFVVDYRWL